MQITGIDTDSSQEQIEMYSIAEMITNYLGRCSFSTIHLYTECKFNTATMSVTLNVNL